MKKIILFILMIFTFTAVFGCNQGDVKPKDDDTNVTPQEPPKTEQEIEQEKLPFEPSNSIVVVGDSLLDFWDNGETFLSDYYVTAKNKAIKATHVYDWFATDRNYSKILEDNPDEVLIGVGINDIKADTKVSVAVGIYKDLINNLLTDNPNLIIHMISVNKSEAAKYWLDEIEEFNSIMKEFCDEHDNMYFINDQDIFLNEDKTVNSSLFIEDNLHFSEDGYKVLEGLLKKHFIDFKSSK